MRKVGIVMGSTSDLPVVEKATRGDIAVYSFISGVVLSIAVPVLVGLVAGV